MDHLWHSIQFPSSSSAPWWTATSLDLVPMNPLNAPNMNKVFRKKQ
ncbi:MAG: hypothetical protein IJT83_10200 [Victivallales bacterium]|nr:hypothetical protein [Victivallales bacterium]